MTEKNIIDSVLSDLSFSDTEKNKFKEMLIKVQSNKKYGIPKNVKSELKKIIERDDINEN